MTQILDANGYHRARKINSYLRVPHAVQKIKHFCSDIVNIFSEPNIYAPVIVSKYTNKRGIPLFRGDIHVDETTVTIDPPITAYDNDTVGSASKFPRRRNKVRKYAEEEIRCVFGDKR